MISILRKILNYLNLNKRIDKVIAIDPTNAQKQHIKKLCSTEPRSIPYLCGRTPGIFNEFRMMRLVGELENSNELILDSFDKIYREDGGAIYLAKYKTVK